MKLFISWSGETSRDVALVLRSWLPQVLQAVQPFVSSEDIEKGARWGNEIASILDETSQGIVIVTLENQSRPWLNFEAGALAKLQTVARVRTLLWDLSNAEIDGPLSTFQSTRIRDAQDMELMIQGLNSSLEVPVDKSAIRKVFERSWPDFMAELDAVQGSADEGETAARPVEDMVEEILERIRAIQRNSDVVPMADWERELLYGASPDSPDVFKVGDAVRHKKFGRGLIQQVSRKALVVEFNRGGSRSFSLGSGLNGLEPI